MTASLWRQSLLAVCLVLAVSGEVPVPQNVRMESVNLKNILKWDPPISHKEHMTYTAQYTNDFLSTSFYKPVPVCQNIKRLECDFSRLSYAGYFYLHVRAEFQNRTSNWVKIHFTPLSQTIIGPPQVILESRSGYLDVICIDPVHEYEQRSLKECYGSSWTYEVRYWKKDDPNPQTAVTTQNIKTLSGLDPWTMYCLEVQAVAEDYNQRGQLSGVHCERTTDDGKTPEWVIIITFLLAMAVMLGLVTAGYFTILYIYRTARYVFFPACSLPHHLKEYLNKPFYNAPFLAPEKQENHESCTVCTVVTDETEAYSQEHAAFTDNRAELLHNSRRPLSNECEHLARMPHTPFTLR
ncbi:interleukin-10 receptor subunit beta isoform X2 [Rhinatrema bivittatum]|uniref:interleukin-10 receptor subunit beta isoform X2 n=1 Tax=Rhinatrema bivittatum TaxID=194408 RepID=UPI0011280166|nr:interleukin-10 receptor subunit beta isoform X2 [Rhinatrema bivittatum]